MENQINNTRISFEPQPDPAFLPPLLTANLTNLSFHESIVSTRIEVPRG
jgi:hypothetical protein